MKRSSALAASARFRQCLRLRTRSTSPSVSTSTSWSPAPAPSWSVHRQQLLGCGMLLLTIFSGYAAAQRSVAADHARRHLVDDESRLIIKEAAIRYGVSEDLIAAVIEAESQFNPRAVSRRGAQGLMQLMPQTAATLGVEDPFSPHQNIHGGVRHLRSLMDRFDNNVPLALAAYNAGHVAVINHGGIPPYPQTRAYVSRIMRQLKRNGATVQNAHPTRTAGAPGGRPPAR